MSSIAGGAAIGAGVGISSVALMPFNAANTFLGSAFFGYGMILGERYMYQADWPKIQQRLENGEKIENIIQEYTGTFQAVVMKEAKIIFDSVTREMIDIIKASVIPEGSVLSDLEHFIHGHGSGHPTVTPQPSPESTGGVIIPPIEVPKPVPAGKTDSQLIDESFGKIRSSIRLGVNVYSVWSHISRTGDAYADWAKISGTNLFSRNLSAAKVFGHQAWPTTTYYLKLISGVWYYLLK